MAPEIGLWEGTVAAGRIGRCVLLSIGLLVLGLYPLPAMAFDLGQWIPGLKVSPFLSERVEYDSNVFQTPSHSKDDLIFKTIPGFLADYTFGNHSLSAGYRAEILRYLDLTNQDTVHHIAVGQLRLDFPRTLLTLRDDFTRTSDPPGTELTGRILSTTNVLKPEGEYRLTPSFSTGLNYSWTRTRFDDRAIGDLIDRDEHRIGASVFWKIVPKGDLFFNYTYGISNFTESTDRDFTSHNITVGLRGEITAKLSSGFYVGYTREDPVHGNQTSFNGLIFGGDTTYKPIERLTITLSTQRARQESTFGTTVFYVTSNGNLSVTYQLLPKVTLAARVGGGLNDYSTKQTADGKTDFRHDTFLLGGAQADYDIQPWLRVGLEYLRTSRDSNFPSFRFVEDRITGRATVQF
jgi:putative beta-barrel porin BBP2